MNKLLFLLLLPLSTLGQLGDTKENILTVLNSKSCGYCQGDYTVNSTSECITQEFKEYIICYNLKEDTCSDIMLLGTKDSDEFYNRFIHKLYICSKTMGSGIEFSQDYIIYKITQ